MLHAHAHSLFALCVIPPLQVYTSLQPDAYFLQLANDGAGLKAAWSAFSAMQDAIGVLNWYYALNGISILLLIARWGAVGTRVNMSRMWVLHPG